MSAANYVSIHNPDPYQQTNLSIVCLFDQRYGVHSFNALLVEVKQHFNPRELLNELRTELADESFHNWRRKLQY